jgi:hypothetical protein
MTKRAKKKPRRPDRPTLSTRTSQELRRALDEAAARSGRSIAQEAEAWLERALAWEQTLGDMKSATARHKQMLKGELETALRDAGYIPVHDLRGKFWLEPGMDRPAGLTKINAAFVQAIADASPGIAQAIAEVLARTEKGELDLPKSPDED